MNNSNEKGKKVIISLAKLLTIIFIFVLSITSNPYKAHASFTITQNNNMCGLMGGLNASGSYNQSTGAITITASFYFSAAVDSWSVLAPFGSGSGITGSAHKSGIWSDQTSNILLTGISAVPPNTSFSIPISASVVNSSTNNCPGASMQGTLTLSIPPTTVTLSANPSSIPSGSASTLTWSSTNATSCTASGAWSGTKATSGSASTGALTTSKSYSIMCTGSGGNSPIVSRAVTVVPAPTVNISANPTTVASGSTSNITWNSTNATSCNITKAGSAWKTGTNGTNVSSGVLTSNTTFTATCTGIGGSANDSAIVNVTVTPPQNFDYSLSASNVSMTPGSTGTSNVGTTFNGTSSPVTPSLTSITDINGNEVLGTQANNIHFVTFTPSIISPPAISILTLSAGSSVLSGNYTGHVQSITSDQASANIRNTTFLITVIAGASPAGLSVVAGACDSGAINISWNRMTGATSYKLYRNGTFLKTVAQPASGSVTTSDNSGLTAGGLYGYTVSTVYTAGESAQSTQQSDFAPDPAQCLGGSASCSLIGSVAGNNVSVYYSVSNDPNTTYILTRTPSFGSKNITVGNSSNYSSTYYDTNLFNGTYSYTLSRVGGASCSLDNATVSNQNNTSGVKMWIKNPANASSENLTSLKIRIGQSALIRYRKSTDISWGNCSNSLIDQSNSVTHPPAGTTADSYIVSGYPRGTYTFKMSCHDSSIADPNINVSALNGNFDTLRVIITDSTIEEI